MNSDVLTLNDLSRLGFSKTENSPYYKWNYQNAKILVWFSKEDSITGIDISVGSETIKSLDGFTTCAELVGEMDELRLVDDNTDNSLKNKQN